MPRFPSGRRVAVATDDGASIHTVTVDPGGDGSHIDSHIDSHIVLVHGLTSNLDDLGPIAERLIADGFPVTGIDQRGHGGSTVGRDGFGPERQARDLEQVLVELDIRDAVLVGHSMGGITILQMTLDRPAVADERSRGIVLLAAPTSLGARWRKAITELVRIPQPSALIPDRRRLRSATAASVFGRKPSLFMLDQALDSYFRCPEQTRRDATLGLRDYDVTDRLDQIEKPVRVIVGDRDRIVPPENALAAARLAPDAEPTVLAGVGHMLIWERVAEVADEIAVFTKTVAQRAS